MTRRQELALAARALATLALVALLILIAPAEDPTRR